MQFFTLVATLIATVVAQQAAAPQESGHPLPTDIIAQLKADGVPGLDQAPGLAAKQSSAPQADEGAAPAPQGGDDSQQQQTSPEEESSEGGGLLSGLL